MDSGAQGTAAKPGSKKKKVAFLALFLVLLLAGGGGAYFAVKKKGALPDLAKAHETGHAEAHAKSDDNSEHSEEHAEPKKAEHGEEHAEAKKSDHAEEASEAHAEGHKDHQKSEHDTHVEGRPVHERPSLLVSWLSKNEFFSALLSIDQKVEQIRDAEKTAERLQFENANLRQKVEAMRMSCQAAFSEKRTKSVESSLTRDTGSRIGRTLASISYKPPANLFPEQLYVLAVSYFKKKDDERAAVILTYLTNLEDSDRFKTASDLLMTGVSWYRLDNLELASDYFERVLKTEAQGENLKRHAHARLWLGLASHRMGQTAKTQKWLREFMDFHPKAKEAAWINGNGSSSQSMERAPASEEAE